MLELGGMYRNHLLILYMRMVVHCLPFLYMLLGHACLKGMEICFSLLENIQTLRVCTILGSSCNEPVVSESPTSRAMPKPSR